MNADALTTLLLQLQSLRGCRRARVLAESSVTDDEIIRLIKLGYLTVDDEHRIHFTRQAYAHLERKP